MQPWQLAAASNTGRLDQYYRVRRQEMPTDAEEASADSLDLHAHLQGVQRPCGNLNGIAADALIVNGRPSTRPPGDDRAAVDGPSRREPALDQRERLFFQLGGFGVTTLRHDCHRKQSAPTQAHGQQPDQQVGDNSEHETVRLYYDQPGDVGLRWSR